MRISLFRRVYGNLDDFLHSRMFCQATDYMKQFELFCLYPSFMFCHLFAHSDRLSIRQQRKCLLVACRREGYLYPGKTFIHQTNHNGRPSLMAASVTIVAARCISHPDVSAVLRLPPTLKLVLSAKHNQSNLFSLEVLRLVEESYRLC